MVILASKSPRRRELLEQIGCSFRIVVSDADEVADNNLDPEKLVMENARLKAVAVSRLYPDIPVVGADTVVSLAGRIYGKPQSEDMAREMLSSLSGRMHAVSTGIAIAWHGELWQQAETTMVEFSELSPEDIAAYVATGEPMDKAGAYGIQGRAAAYIKGIKGSYSNVVGLPLHALCQLARKAGADLYGDGEGASSL